MSKCPHCGTEYIEGDSVDIGIGFQQITPDYPDCACEYIEYMEKNKKFKEEQE